MGLSQGQTGLSGGVLGVLPAQDGVVGTSPGVREAGPPRLGRGAVLQALAAELQRFYSPLAFALPLCLS